MTKKRKRNNQPEQIPSSPVQSTRSQNAVNLIPSSPVDRGLIRDVIANIGGAFEHLYRPIAQHSDQPRSPPRNATTTNTHVGAEPVSRSNQPRPLQQTRRRARPDPFRQTNRRDRPRVNWNRLLATFLVVGASALFQHCLGTVSRWTLDNSWFRRDDGAIDEVSRILSREFEEEGGTRSPQTSGDGRL